MSFMQRTHGRHKTYLLSLLANFEQLVLKVDYLFEYFHFGVQNNNIFTK